jgi:SPP1 gp7 family putative phage head morphogenesis protein
MTQQLRKALQMEKDRLRYEAIGMIHARAAAARARGAVLRTWLRTGDAGAVQTALAVHLSPLIPLVTDGMIAGHLAGVSRTQESVVERGEGRRGIRLSSAYENALRFLRERTGMTAEQQESLRLRYDTAATQVVAGATKQAQDKVSQAIRESIEAGDGVKRGSTKVAAAMEAAGLGAQKKHTLEQVFRTQTQLAYSAGRMNSLSDPAIQEILWGFEYVTVGDSRVRPAHCEMDGHKAPKEDPIWSRWTPPNGYNCRCAILEIFDGGTPSTKTPDVQPDKGFAFNPGDLTEGVVEASTPQPVLKPMNTHPSAPPPGASGSQTAPAEYDAEYEMWANTLTKDEFRALREWEANPAAMADIRQVSAGLPPLYESQQTARENYDLFTTAASKCPPFEGVTYRGLADPPKELMDQLTNVGGEVSIDKYSSATKSRNAAEWYASRVRAMELGEDVPARVSVVMKMKTKTGMDLAGITGQKASEEVVLRPGVRYRVVGKPVTVTSRMKDLETKEEKSVTYQQVELEEVDPAAPPAPTKNTPVIAPAAEEAKPGDKPKPQPGRYTGTLTYSSASSEQTLTDALRGSGLKTDDPHVAIAAMVPDAARFPVLKVHATKDGINVKAVTGDGSRIDRTIRSIGGRPVMINNEFYIPKEAQGKGYGTQFFSDQVENAQRVGIAEIRTSAARSGTENGYYTWPRLGYDAKLEDFRDYLQARLPAGFSWTQNISDLMATPEGRAYWKKWGTDAYLKFDLDPDSLSLKVLKAYKAEKAKRNG